MLPFFFYQIRIFKKQTQKCEKINGWDDHPIYLPMLVLPKQKFVFMFNYDDDLVN